MAKPPKLPKIKVNIPRALQITGGEQAQLKKTFNTSVVLVLRSHPNPSSDITNVEPTVVDMAVVDGAAYGRSTAKSKAGKKASKKAGKKK